MEKDIVCDASPLIFLAKIRRIDLLNTYSLFIPFQVEAEILKGIRKEREDAKTISEYLKERKITPFKISLLRDLPDFLGSGEKAVISLAVKEKIENVLIDESKARTVARFKGLHPKGTLGILWDSYKAGNIDRNTTEALSFELIEKGYRIKEELFIEFLKRLKGLT